jgi:hypothetical protein
VIEIYNGKNNMIDLLKSIVAEVKKISEKARKTQDTTKCAILTLKEQ